MCLYYKLINLPNQRCKLKFESSIASQWFNEDTLAHAGKVISHRPMAGTVKFIRTAADTGGELLEMEATYNKSVDIAAKVGASDHVHPHQDEQIEVLAGMVSGFMRKVGEN